MRLMAQHPGGDRRIVWPFTAAPRVDDTITLPDGQTYQVQYVDWHPQGDADNAEPFVYVVAR